MAGLATSKAVRCQSLSVRILGHTKRSWQEVDDLGGSDRPKHPAKRCACSISVTKAGPLELLELRHHYGQPRTRLLWSGAIRLTRTVAMCAWSAGRPTTTSSRAPRAREARRGL